MFPKSNTTDRTSCMYILGLRKLSGVPCSQQQQPYAVLAWITLTICSRPVVYILISKGYGFVQGSLAKGQFTLDTTVDIMSGIIKLKLSLLC